MHDAEEAAAGPQHRELQVAADGGLDSARVERVEGGAARVRLLVVVSVHPPGGGLFRVGRGGERDEE